MRIIRSHITPIFLVVLMACIEPYTPGIKESPEPAYAVEGVITDEPGPYQVKISRTIPLNTNQFEGVSGIEIIIEEENGESEKLTEVAPGIYETRNIQGVVGKRYRIELTIGRNNYRSEWEEIETTPQMDSLKHRVINLGVDPANKPIDAVEYLLSFEGSTEDARYYRYNFEETWLARSSFPSYYEYVGFDSVITRDPQIRRCYKSRSIHPTTLISTAELSSNSVQDYSIKKITGEDERYVHRHTLELIQYGLDADEYAYWQLVKEANENVGNLYDKQPFSVFGNISNTDDPDDRLFGYFSASSVKKTRVYLNNQPGLSEQYYCGENFRTYMKAVWGSRYEEQLTAMLNNGYMLYYLIYSEGPFPAVIGATVARDACIDCRLNGGTVEKPDFWYD